MKKLGMFCLTLLLCVSLFGCSKPKPDPVVTSFCDAMQQYDFEAMKACMTADWDESQDDLFSEEEEMEEESMLILKECAAKMTYEIESSEVTDDTANVTVSFTYQDLSPMLTNVMGEYIQQAFAMAFTGAGADEETMSTLFDTIFREQYDAAELTTITESMTFGCENTEEGWKIATIPEEFVDVATANMVQALEDLASDMNWAETEEAE